MPFNDIFFGEGGKESYHYRDLWLQYFRKNKQNSKKLMVVPVQKREDDILPLLYALWLSKNITLGGQKRAYSTVHILWHFY